MTKRTDVHSPGNLVTEDYEYLCVIDHDQADESMGEASRQRTHLVSELVVKPGHRFAGIHPSGQCDHCGARIRYAALMLHTPTGTVIEVGETCLENRFERASADFHAARKAAQLDRQRQRIKNGVRRFVEDHPDLAWMATGDIPEASQGNDFVVDVAGKLVTYGGLSERQVTAVRKAVKRDAERAAEKAAEVWVPIPRTGRTTVTGVVLSTRAQEGYWGTTYKMLLKVPHGDGAWKLWTTIPSQARNLDRGDTLTIRVAVERSDDDDTFGFGTRPTLVSHEPAERQGE